MMYSSLLCVFMIACVVPADADLQGYEVSEIVRVVSPVEFECRLVNYPYSKAVRFKVTIRGVELSGKAEDPTVSQAFLETQLKQAKRIELKRLQVRNYFRVTADVLIDGKNLRDIYIQKEDIQPIGKDAVKTEDVMSLSRRRLLYQEASGNEREPGKTTNVVSIKPNSETNIITLRDLLETTVNLSEIHTETTLEEAIDLVRNSVNPPLPLIVLWGDLERNAFLEKDTPVEVDGFRQIKLQQGLKIILQSVTRSRSQLYLAIEGGVITLGTENSFGNKRETRVYSVADLSNPPAFYMGYGQSGQQGGYGNSMSAYGSGTGYPGSR